MEKAELVNWLEDERQQWDALLDQIGPEHMEQPNVAGHWSIKDIVAHLTGWERRNTARIHAAARGEPEPPPPWPAHLEDEDDINAWFYETNHGRPLAEVLDDSRQALEQLVAAVQELPDDVLIEPAYHVVQLGGKRYSASEFLDHFHDDHEPGIRAWLALRATSGAADAGGENDRGNLTATSFWKTVVWHQFGAAIDTLDDMLRACPDELWRARSWEKPGEAPEFAEFWYRVYHALFWLDLYLTGTEQGFAPPAPFTLIDQDEHGPLPERPYTREELQDYLAAGRRKCRATIEALTDETAHRRCRFGWGEVTFAELLLYNMRHVQEIAAQLSLLLGQHGVAVPDSAPTARPLDRSA